MMSEDRFEATVRGTYTEPFTQTQYGAFKVEEDGSLSFVGASIAGKYGALIVVDNFNRDMKLDSHPVVVRTRTITYSPWDEGGEEIPDVADAMTDYHNRTLRGG